MKNNNEIHQIFMPWRHNNPLASERMYPEEYYFRSKVTNHIGAPIVYNITTDGIYLPNKIDTLRLNADSTYQITHP